MLSKQSTKWKMTKQTNPATKMPISEAQQKRRPIPWHGQDGKWHAKQEEEALPLGRVSSTKTFCGKVLSNITPDQLTDNTKMWKGKYFYNWLQTWQQLKTTEIRSAFLWQQGILETVYKSHQKETKRWQYMAGTLYTSRQWLKKS